MVRKLAVVPERCSGCKICELVCSIERFGVNNPKKSAIRVMVVYPIRSYGCPLSAGNAKSPMHGKLSYRSHCDKGWDL